jgi:protein gp37
MAENTSIEWCDHTFNPWIGCTKVSPACDHCYAEVSTPARTMKVIWGVHAERHHTADSTWAMPKRWNDQHEAFFAQHGRRQRVFCASLADVFDNQVPEQWRTDLFELIRLTPNLDWLLLTKRPQNIVRMVRSSGAIAGNGARYLPDNVWLGTTAEDQIRANQNIPALLRTRSELGARVLFLSMEPLLGPVDLHLFKTTVEERLRVQRELASTPGEFQRLSSRGEMLNWIIVGGESGPNARECQVSHIRGIVQQSKAAGLPVFVKQLGAQPRGWCASNVHSDDVEPDDDSCDFYEAGECSGPCHGRCPVFVDKKCGDPAEWPEDLRVREFPASDRTLEGVPH